MFILPYNVYAFLLLKNLCPAKSVPPATKRIELIGSGTMGMTEPVISFVDVL